MAVKYPNVTVQLVGEDGNAFGVLAAVRRALVNANVPKDEIKEYMPQAMDGDYDNLLRVTMETVNVT